MTDDCEIFSSRFSRRGFLTAAGTAGAGLAAGSLVGAGSAQAAEQPQFGQPGDPVGTPRVSGLHLQFGADAASEVVVSWHCLQPVTHPRVLLGHPARSDNLRSQSRHSRHHLGRRRNRGRRPRRRTGGCARRRRWSPGRRGKRKPISPHRHSGLAAGARRRRHRLPGQPAHPAPGRPATPAGHTHHPTPPDTGRQKNPDAAIPGRGGPAATRSEPPTCTDEGIAGSPLAGATRAWWGRRAGSTQRVQLLRSIVGRIAHHPPRTHALSNSTHPPSPDCRSKPRRVRSGLAELKYPRSQRSPARPRPPDSPGNST